MDSLHSSSISPFQLFVISRFVLQEIESSVAWNMPSSLSRRVEMLLSVVFSNKTLLLRVSDIYRPVQIWASQVGVFKYVFVHGPHSWISYHGISRPTTISQELSVIVWSQGWEVYVFDQIVVELPVKLRLFFMIKWVVSISSGDKFGSSQYAPDSVIGQI